MVKSYEITEQLRRERRALDDNRGYMDTLLRHLKQEYKRWESTKDVEEKVYLDSIASHEDALIRLQERIAKLTKQLGEHQGREKCAVCGNYTKNILNHMKKKHPSEYIKVEPIIEKAQILEEKQELAQAKSEEVAVNPVSICPCSPKCLY